MKTPEVYQDLNFKWDVFRYCSERKESLLTDYEDFSYMQPLLHKITDDGAQNPSLQPHLLKFSPIPSLCRHLLHVDTQGLLSVFLCVNDKIVQVITFMVSVHFHDQMAWKYRPFTLQRWWAGKLRSWERCFGKDFSTMWWPKTFLSWWVG